MIEIGKKYSTFKNLLHVLAEMDLIRTTNSNLGAKESVECPVCGGKFEKRSKGQVYCSNKDTHGAVNCKDMYWDFKKLAVNNEEDSEHHEIRYIGFRTNMERPLSAQAHELINKIKDETKLRNLIRLLEAVVIDEEEEDTYGKKNS